MKDITHTFFLSFFLSLRLLATFVNKKTVQREPYSVFDRFFNASSEVPRKVLFSFSFSSNPWDVLFSVFFPLVFDSVCLGTFTDKWVFFNNVKRGVISIVCIITSIFFEYQLSRPLLCPIVRRRDEIWPDMSTKKSDLDDSAIIARANSDFFFLQIRFRIRIETKLREEK